MMKETGSPLEHRGLSYDDPPAGDRVVVLVKALRILSALSESDGGLALKDVVRTVGITKSTSHRILKTLTQHGFVERDARGRYAIGIKAFQVGSSFRQRLDLRQRVLPVLQDLNTLTDETVFLVVRHENRAVCLERIEGKFGSTLFLSIGGSLPLHTGAAPRVLLAFLAAEELDAYLEHPIEKLTPFTVVDREAIRTDVQDTREQLGCIGVDNVLEGMKAYGAPIFGADEDVVGAISVGGLTLSIPESRDAELFRAVRGAAAAASEAMGSRAMAERLRSVVG
jgi:DNA-binding IclR family transcriptional regulator